MTLREQLSSGAYEVSPRGLLVMIKSFPFKKCCDLSAMNMTVSDIISGNPLSRTPKKKVKGYKKEDSFFLYFLKKLDSLLSLRIKVDNFCHFALAIILLSLIHI